MVSYHAQKGKKIASDKTICKERMYEGEGGKGENSGKDDTLNLTPKKIPSEFRALLNFEKGDGSK